MKQPILHKATEAWLNNYLRSPSHALILSGEKGVGKLYIAQWLAAQLNLDALTIAPDAKKQSISIDQIRDLYNTTRTGMALCVIIEDAHRLSSEAQNAFLKLLEEPPKNTLFILTATSTTALLPTIRSRAQAIEILKPSIDELTTYGSAHSSLSENELRSLAVTSKARPATFVCVISSDETKNIHQSQVTEAKTFYAADPYSRHIMCIENKFEKEWSSTLLELLATIIESLTKANSTKSTQLKSLKKQAELVEDISYNILKINGNPKIHLTKLAEQL